MKEVGVANRTSLIVSHTPGECNTFNHGSATGGHDVSARADSSCQAFTLTGNASLSTSQLLLSSLVTSVPSASEGNPVKRKVDGRRRHNYTDEEVAAYKSASQKRKADRLMRRASPSVVEEGQGETVGASLTENPTSGITSSVKAVGVGIAVVDAPTATGSNSMKSKGGSKRKHNYTDDDVAAYKSASQKYKADRLMRPANPLPALQGTSETVGASLTEQPISHITSSVKCVDIDVTVTVGADASTATGGDSVKSKVKVNNRRKHNYTDEDVAAYGIASQKRKEDRFRKYIEPPVSGITDAAVDVPTAAAGNSTKSKGGSRRNHNYTDEDVAAYGIASQKRKEDRLRKYTEHLVSGITSSTAAAAAGNSIKSKGGSKRKHDYTDEEVAAYGRKIQKRKEARLRRRMDLQKMRGAGAGIASSVPAVQSKTRRGCRPRKYYFYTDPLTGECGVAEPDRVVVGSAANGKTRNLH
jgi:hypothetical protein